MAHLSLRPLTLEARMWRQMHPSVCVSICKQNMNLKMLVRRYVPSSENTCQRWIHLAKFPTFFHSSLSKEPMVSVHTFHKENELVGGLQCGIRWQMIIQVYNSSWFMIDCIGSSGKIWQNDESCILYAQRIRAWLAFQETPNWQEICRQKPGHENFLQVNQARCKRYNAEVYKNYMLQDLVAVILGPLCGDKCCPAPRANEPWRNQESL